MIGTVITNNEYSRLSYVTLKDIWSYNYYIQFNKNKPRDLKDSDITGKMDTIYIYNNQKTKLASNSYIAKYYKFIGWSTNKNATTPMFEDGDYVQNLAEYDYQTIIL